ncbi:hypothetical protein [Gelidibacter mesophilus]|uniref:hypothetical protein n=1 Tax=Gelidibacter mesophilus TaxID=169050 RepID=UPI00040798D5|nr:hypothetical protein [Gelidibacter mesophilus]
MELKDIVNIVLGIIASIGGSGVIIWFLVKLFANTLADKYKEKIKLGFEKELESYRNQLEVLKATTLKYNDRQFELYLDLWKNLQELKFSCLDLWSLANKPNLQKFKESLKKTDRQIETSSILIELNHYSELREIIKNFKEYDFGKQRLIENRINNINEVQIDEMIEFNRERKDKCLELIELIKTEIQTKIKGGN